MDTARIAFILALIASASSFRVFSSWPSMDGRIVGGEDASPGEFPYQLSLRIDGVHACGASILSEDWAVTAAHCVHTAGDNSLQLMAGSLDVDEGVIYNVSSFTVHPNYDPATTDWDIAVLKVSTPFALSSAVSPIALPEEGEELDVGTIVVVSGWGDLSEEGPNAKFLQKVTIPIYDHNECALAYIMSGGITDRMICAGVKQGGKDACQGDSGGPLVTHGKLYGVVSWGRGCGERGYPGVYAKVSSMNAFIAKETGLK